MKTLNELFREKGYRIYMCSLDQRYMSFVQEESYCVNIICYFDERSATSTTAQMQAFLEAHKGRLDYGRGKDFHFLKLVATDALGVGRLVPGTDGHGLDGEAKTESAWVDQVWYLIDDANTDPESGQPLGVRLFVPAGAPEDFYGLRGALEQHVAAEGIRVELPEMNLDQAARTRGEMDRAPAEQGVDGRPVFHKNPASAKDPAWATLGLVLITALMFILQSLKVFEDGDFALHEDTLRQSSQWYRLFTYMFLHSSVPHLAGNMLMLYAAGSMVEERMNRVAFFFLYFFSGVCGGMLSVWHQMRIGEEYRSFGASGAIYGIVGALIAWMVMTRQWRSFQFFSRLIIALLLLFYTSTMEADIDYMSHLGGFLAGLLFAGIYIMISWKRRKPLRNERKA